MLDPQFDQQFRDACDGLVCGVDEAGRGPLAGPVYAAAVILSPDRPIEGLNDSKKLSEKKREALYDMILERAESYCIASASVAEIEEYNILGATYLAMTRAVQGLSVKPQLALIDGNRIPPQLEVAAQTVVKGDAQSESIAAASILAKVTRDRLLIEMDAQYPQYGFAVHKGYGTAAHTAALKEYGPCPEHRPSFLKKILGDG
jgi:ribonuclease HII